MHEGGSVNGSEPPARPHQRLRTLVVIKCLGYGGAERLLVDTVASGDKQAFEYEVAFVLSAENALASVIEEGGTPVHSLGAGHNWDLRWMARFRALLVAGRFDVVHFHLPYTASLGRLVVATIPSATRPAVVYTEHSLWNKMAILVKWLNRAAIGRDGSLIVVSQASRDALPEGLKDRARIIVHGVDLSRSDALVIRRHEIRREVRAELGIAEDETLVLTVANLRAEKGYDVLLDTAHLIGSRGLPVRFAAVGWGPIEEQVKQRHHELDLGDRFQFLGERHDVLRLLVASDVFVLASRQEGLPVVLMEATSAGLPIVATKVGGVPQVITDGVDGLIVPPGQPRQLADALERVCSDPALAARLGRAAKLRSAMFDVASASRQIEGIYRELAEAHH